MEIGVRARETRPRLREAVPEHVETGQNVLSS
jgi:hypothetical protein